MFDYYLDSTMEFVPWTNIVGKLKYSREMLFSRPAAQPPDLPVYVWDTTILMGRRYYVPLGWHHFTQAIPIEVVE